MTKDEIAQRFAALEERIAYLESCQTFDSDLVTSVKRLKGQVADLEACRDGDDGLVKTVEQLEVRVGAVETRLTVTKRAGKSADPA